jgi:tetratricopeptide (TPR) repeat protein/CHAT domain-containing protein
MVWRSGWVVARGVWLAFLVATGATTAGSAQPRDDLTFLNRQVVGLINEGKYAQAMPLAQRALALSERQHGPNHPEVGVALNNLAEVHRAIGRYAEAEALYKRDLAITEKARGSSHPDVASTLNNLALLYAAQGRPAEAEPLARRSLEIREKALGADSPQVANSLNTLAGLYDNLGRYQEAEPLCKRSLSIREKAMGPHHPDVGASLNNLAALFEAQGRYDEAEPLYQRAITILEKALGADHPDVGASLNNLALLYKLQGRYAEAEPLYKRDLAINEKVVGPDHPDVASSLGNLGLLYYSQGRYAEAEPFYRRSLEIRERVLGLDHPAVAASLNSLAGLFYAEDRYGEAEPLLKRSLTIREKALGPDHPEVGNALNNLAGLYSTLKRHAEAEPLMQRALSITEKSHGANHPIVGTPLNNLALLLAEQGRYAEAERLAQRSLAVREQGLGREHADVATSLNTLAKITTSQGRHAEAETLYKRSIAIFEKALGPDHPDLTGAINNLAALSFERQDWAMAAGYWQKSTASIIKRWRRGNDVAGKTFTGATRVAEQNGYQFGGLIKASHRLAAADPSKATELAQATFIAAQWAQSSEAAASLAQMSARQAKGDSELARLVRERQDLLGEWQERDRLLIANAAKPKASRNAAAEQGQRSRLAAIDARLAEIDQTLQARFPEYTALAAPEPVSVAATQALLGSDEALVMFLDSPGHDPKKEETFLWLVTRTDVRWLRTELDGGALVDAVAALRCGLDAEAWSGSRCADLLKAAYSPAERQSGKPPPFSLRAAHAFYRALFGEIETLIAGKHLLLVASGPLTALPFQVLVTETPNDATSYANAAWLAARQPTTVLPSVASLRALREFMHASGATRPFLGFGNPLLLGPNGTDRRAWERQTCRPSVTPMAIASRGARGAIPRFFRGGRADVREVRAQPPLPETTDELCAVAKSVGAEDNAVFLGEKASETRIKALSADGTLASSRVLHFATHGLLAGETEMLASAKAEPALILTPPTEATDEDDGLLTASEVTQLKLDADWVVLSACNTAAGSDDKPGAEALSGLARAFFYAGARALLVSHWAVNSEATVKLITNAFGELKVNPRIGRAEAMRRSMVALIGNGGVNAHPALWGPFVVVGEGAR